MLLLILGFPENSDTRGPLASDLTRDQIPSWFQTREGLRDPRNPLADTTETTNYILWGVGFAALPRGGIALAPEDIFNLGPCPGKVGAL